MWICSRRRRQQGYMYVQTRSRSDKNVVDARLVRNLAKSCQHDFEPPFLYGLDIHVPLLAAESVQILWLTACGKAVSCSSITVFDTM